jgi:hypothetical protein
MYTLVTVLLLPVPFLCLRGISAKSSRIAIHVCSTLPALRRTRLLNIFILVDDGATSRDTLLKKFLQYVWILYDCKNSVRYMMARNSADQ